MTITINTNVSALTAQRNLGAASMKSASSLAKLSSGSRVPTAKDDAAALAIGSRLTSEVAGLRQASLNAGQGSSLLQIADGAMGQINDILVRMQALAVQSKSGQLSSTERSILNTEFTSLRTEIDRIANDTTFNGRQLLAGSSTTSANNTNLGGDGVATAVDNLTVANGFQSIEFSDSFGDGAVKIEFNSTTNLMTLTNKLTDAKQSVLVTSTSGDESLDFNNLGVVVNINNNFNRAADFGDTNLEGADVAVANLTETLGGANASLITSVNITGVTDGNSGFRAKDLLGATISFDTTAANAMFGTVTVTSSTGVVLNFTSTADTVDASGTATDTTTFLDGNGNSFDLQVVANTVTNGATINATIGHATGNNSATDVSGIELGNITIADADSFAVGNINEGTIAFNTANASAATSSATIGGVAFTGAGVDLTTTGQKTVSLADADGNTIAINFTVNGPFSNNDELSFELMELGDLAGADAVSGASSAFNFQVGTGISASQDVIAFTLSSVTAANLGIASNTITDESTATAAITALSSAVTTLNTSRAGVGSAQSRLDFAASNLAVAIENNSAARSALVDVDVSAEMTEFTSKQVLIQAGVSMLAQANQQPALLLRLLQ